MRSFRNFRYSAVAGALVLAVFLCPSLAVAAEDAGLSLVAGWFIRLGLALLGTTAIVVGVLIALEGYAPEQRITPVAAPESGVALIKERPLSYRRIGAGLLTVIFGAAFLITVVFLLPDKRSGRSGITPVIARLQVVQGKIMERVFYRHRTTAPDAGGRSASH